jgi:hypothetical protein
MPLVGYEMVDACDMVEALADALKPMSSDDNPWLWNSLWKTKDFIQGLIAEGRFD